MRALLLCLLLLAVSLPAQALPPFLNWQTVHSNCCDIHFPAHLSDFAQTVAAISDEVDVTATTFLDSQPSDRVQIVVEDQTDSANGWALTVPYNTIHVYAVAPDNYAALSDSDDWLRSLLLHEYTHIVHMDTVRGIPSAIHSIVGKQWAPNQVQPLWFIEGIAVYAESRFTSGGRVRASLFDMYLRTAALEDGLWTLDELSSGKRAFPSGETPYLYGGRFIDFIARRYGEEVLAKISARYGSQLIPFGINRAATGLLDKSYDQLYGEFLEELRGQANQVKQRVESLGLDHSTRLTHFGQSVRWPVVAPSGEVFFFASPRDNSSAIYRYNPTRKTTERIVEVNGFGGMSALPDGRLLISQPDVFANHYSFHDLYALNPKDLSLQRLTRGLRARSPSLNSSGRFALFVRRDANKCALSRIDLGSGEVSDVALFSDGSQFYTPTLSEDGRFAVVGLWRPGGFRDLWRVDLQDGKLTQLTSDRAMDLDPSFSSSGRHILFSSDRSGIFNIYALDLSSLQVFQLTNVLSGAFRPRSAEGGKVLYYVGFSVDGYDLFQLPETAALGYTASPSYSRPTAVPAAVSRESRVSSYNPLPSLLPHAWLPVLGNDHAGPTLGAAIDGSDAVGIHSYAVQASVGALSGALNVGAAYGYNDLPTPLRTSFSRYERQQHILVDPAREPQAFQTTGYRADISASLPLQRWRNSHALSLGYGIDWAVPPQTLPFEPDQARPSLPWTGRTTYLRLSWGYRSTRRFADSISTERGLSASASLRLSDPLLGSETSFLEGFVTAGLFLQVPSLRNHVVAILLHGGGALGPREHRRLYGAGGLPERNLVEDLVQNVSLGGGYLRGYPSNAFVGDGILLASLEYRLPLLEFERGISTVPLFFNRAYLVAFGDMGGTYLETPRGQDFMNRALGAELRAQFTVGYRLPVEVRLGVARGFDPLGLEAQPYLLMGYSY